MITGVLCTDCMITGGGVPVIEPTLCDRAGGSSDPGGSVVSYRALIVCAIPIH